MIINGIDVGKYFSSHSGQEVATVVNALQAFALNRELELFLKNGMYKKKYAFKDSQRLDERRQSNLERSLRILGGRSCPKCDSPIQGTTKVTCAGRKWYEECTVCKYYMEEFGGA